MAKSGKKTKKSKESELPADIIKAMIDTPLLRDAWTAAIEAGAAAALAVLRHHNDSAAVDVPTGKKKSTPTEQNALAHEDSTD